MRELRLRRMLIAVIAVASLSAELLREADVFSSFHIRPRFDGGGTR
jgi:hypothetical protein